MSDEQRERSPCLGVRAGDMRVLGGDRRVALDVLMMGWGLGTWLGVNGVFVQLPLLVQRLPEGWALPSFMVVCIQLANVGVLAYAALRRLFPRAPDAPYVYGMLGVGTAALFLNAFLHERTAWVAGAERSVAFLAVTFFTGLVGCTSSVLFYPYLRHFRDVYLATYLVGEGLSGLLPGLLSLAQGSGGEPRCVYAPDNASVTAVPPEPRFDSTVFLAVVGCLSALSLASFALLNSLPTFAAERVRPADAAKQDEATGEPLLRARWVGVMAMMAALNACMNGLLPSIQSYSCMPYGAQTYHLAVTLGAMANPLACLAGVWLRPVRGRALAALLGAALLPLGYVLATALLSPAPPLQHSAGGRALVVLAWVALYAALSYARMWVYGWARRGGAAGMRVCGAVNQAGSALGSLTLFLIVNFTDVFVQAPQCALPPL
ncbi:solute carrier family 52, riboflavin transporter, member 3 isoform X2 [Bicyclus anynana]|uniref:Riboflavin transporter n=1 Tax=Bicyclus anynana TaxID=110368 RepID=A0ABM3LKQ0_BICAN|nr:solute carrier family 52, riboflavin transporter, member 3 isoform X2 [Bicyclus anynana]XP_052739631.1 solute carrier family 52, riboflavin transporter, member 3 isoform X2 [Bicyclus anynana]XP_052739632.1 solute carrier family 52, riboflavin transporter, member 3 isoform X2 [Bicyclus anynana]